MVARVLWEHDVAGSNPVIPTKKGCLSHRDQASFSFLVRFQSSIFAMRMESCFASGECCIPTKKGCPSHRDQASFSFLVRFQSSIFATRMESCFASGECCIPTTALVRGGFSFASGKLAKTVPHLSRFLGRIGIIPATKKQGLSLLAASPLEYVFTSTAKLHR